MPKLSIRSTFLLAALIAIALAVPASAQDAPKTEEEKTLYYLGMLAARPLSPVGLTDAELILVNKGIADSVAGKPMDLDPQVYGARVQSLMQERTIAAAAVEQKESQAFLDAEAAKPGVRTLASGLLVEELELGTGEKPTLNDEVVVHYHGTLRDGTVFDSSVKRGKPFTTLLTRVVKCWQEGVPTMRVGGKSRLVCPADLAYGDNGSPPLIKGGAALVFEVELLSVTK
jgi:FKBP-type peptidyl-prolyl cis-trans isomerase FkpA